VRINPPTSLPKTIQPIPLVVELYEHANFMGNRLIVVEDSSNIPVDFGSEFNDVTTSVRVRKGPDFKDGNKAGLFRDVGWRAGGIALPPGDYPNIGTSHAFTDVVSSVSITRDRL
jgi:hypothetical protein